jgi:hypothetical protein
MLAFACLAASFLPHADAANLPAMSARNSHTQSRYSRETRQHKDSTRAARTYKCCQALLLSCYCAAKHTAYAKEA